VLFQRNQSIVVAPIGLDEINEIYNAASPSGAAGMAAVAGKRVRPAGRKAGGDLRRYPQAVPDRRTRGAPASGFPLSLPDLPRCGNSFLTPGALQPVRGDNRLWYITSSRDLQAQADTARSHQPIIDAIYAKDAAHLDREIESHISHAYDQIMQRFIHNTVGRIGDIPINLLQKEGRDEISN